ncbi:Crp/Fnr family transcriptional regulator [Novosphingobium album (ex Hu et al. 2023)]|uniref:Crp/Fnr family transcriptional regulator n=1 Tax=Novosphingobium album (ex Hu et al. 2023) TaxID=2930093 RepID=A0ABT0AWN7_9SPHN|nr:Crp/Fnr family transcriptional regulator [Novosphingobium album (ex Hu et al. 2023)]MCJ2177197.1 Crp/Fnr family transcriptional regulator [Novosphingobium album (ex Hu et al. 2023)]
MTATPSPTQRSNAILNAFPPEARSFLASRLLTKAVMSGEVLHEPGAPLIHVIFPHSGIISLQGILSDGRTVECVSVGNDSLLGIEHFLGENIFLHHATVAISGSASWLPVTDLGTALSQFAPVAEAMQRCSLNRMRDSMQTAICASVHSASQRLATWLLRARDRTGADQFELTQRTLANVFGLRLATVSDACGRLNGAGAIDQGRGTLTIVDGGKLLEMSCECYEHRMMAGL